MDPSGCSPNDLRGGGAGTVAVRLLRDALARVERAIEAAADGDYLFAGSILDDLAADLWRLVERVERKP